MIKHRPDSIIIRQLNRLDSQSIRPLRAIIKAERDGKKPDPADVETLAGYERKAEALRKKLKKGGG